MFFYRKVKKNTIKVQLIYSFAITIFTAYFSINPNVNAKEIFITILNCVRVFFVFVSFSLFLMEIPVILLDIFPEW